MIEKNDQFRNKKKSGFKKKKPRSEMTIGEKKQSFVRWLMKKGVSLDAAKLICARKFYHGDPF